MIPSMVYDRYYNTIVEKHLEKPGNKYNMLKKQSRGVLQKILFGSIGTISVFFIATLVLRSSW